MNLYEIFAILIIHWIADFVLQTDQQAKGKSNNLKDLLSHTVTYSFVWYFVLFVISILGNHFKGPSIEELGWSSYILLFPLITFICHTITDYFTSKLNSKLWKEQKVHLFFVSIGFDQILHYIQLFLTYKLLT